MEIAIKQLVNHFFQKETLDDVTPDELQRFIYDHPYFVAGHFLLAKKAAIHQDETYDKALAKTALYFDNPLWLNWLMKTELPVNTTQYVSINEEEQQEQNGLSISASKVETGNEIHQLDRNTEITDHIKEVSDEDKITRDEGSVNIIIEDRDTADQKELVLESYHTIDYFASQGIRLQLEELTKDKLGQQLKSFTEWLRSMKRLPQSSAETNIDDVTQQSIQRIAEHSIEEKEVVTEAMAEVWLKQGNKEKATDIYNKLSLLNPDKSGYFAAKIENLKNMVI